MTQEEKKISAIRIPTILVVGDQNNGKTSLLERIAGFDCFPRMDGFCTRQPIRLRLIHNPDATGLDSFKLTMPSLSYTDSSNVVQTIDAFQGENLDKHLVLSKISDRMDSIKSTGKVFFLPNGNNVT
jgi:hypothetical protein